MNNIKFFQEKYAEAIATKKELENAVEEADNVIMTKEDELALLGEALEIAQFVASAIQQYAHQNISTVVTTCLHSVFGDEYDFEIRFEQKRNKTEACPVFIKNGNVIKNPMKGVGGGILDVASFALRLSAVILSKPKCRKLIFFDEPFKFVSEEYREQVGNLLTELSNKYNIQFVQITHIEELKIGKLIAL